LSTIYSTGDKREFFSNFTSFEQSFFQNLQFFEPGHTNNDTSKSKKPGILQISVALCFVSVNTGDRILSRKRW